MQAQRQIQLGGDSSDRFLAKARLCSSLSGGLQFWNPLEREACRQAGNDIKRVNSRSKAGAWERE